MKRTILAVLMAVLVATPCLAQEVETDGLFSIEGTRWVSCGISFLSVPPFIWPECASVGFYQDTVYSCSLNGDCQRPRPSMGSYIDSPVVSIWYDFDNGNLIAIMQPIGLGVLSFGKFGWPLFGFEFGIAIMFKVDDNWTP